MVLACIADTDLLRKFFRSCWYLTLRANMFCFFLSVSSFSLLFATSASLFLFIRYSCNMLFFYSLLGLSANGMPSTTNLCFPSLTEDGVRSPLLPDSIFDWGVASRLKLWSLSKVSLPFCSRFRWLCAYLLIINSFMPNAVSRSNKLLLWPFCLLNKI